MSRINDDVIDLQLERVRTCDIVYICTAQPTSYAEAISLSIATKIYPVFSVIDGLSSRQTILEAFADGVATGAGSGLYVAGVNSTDSEMIFNQVLYNTVAITSGQVISLSDTYISIDVLPQEAFDTENTPVFNSVTLNGEPCGLALPWNYDDANNSSRTYPLIVWCGPSGTVGTDLDVVYSTAPDQLIIGGSGGDWEIGEYLQRTPSFVYAIQHAIYTDETTGAIDALDIETLKSTYRIDPDRIYLMGFSMGGSATHYIANAHYALVGEHQLASVLRIVGYFNDTIDDPGLPVWYNIGLDDAESWIEFVRQSYAKYKSDRPNGVEVQLTGTKNEGAVLHKIYTLGGEEVCRYTEYTGVGHGYLSVFADSEIFDWIMRKRK